MDTTQKKRVIAIVSIVKSIVSIVVKKKKEDFQNESEE